MRGPTASLIVGALAILLGLPQGIARCEMLELRGAAVLVPGDMTSREKKAAEMLLDEVESRTQIRWPLVQSWPGGQTPVVVVGEAGAVKKLAGERGASVPSGNDTAEGYRIWTD